MRTVNDCSLAKEFYIHSVRSAQSNKDRWLIYHMQTDEAIMQEISDIISEDCAIKLKVATSKKQLWDLYSEAPYLSDVKEEILDKILDLAITQAERHGILRISKIAGYVHNRAKNLISENE